MRGLILVCCLFVSLLSNAYANPESRSWDFDVFLDDDLIGKHSFVVTEVEGKNIVEINAKFDVKFLFFNAYQYRHQNKEIWQSQCLQKIDSFTNDNGTEYRVVGKRKENIFKLNINDSAESIDACVKSFFYWDSDILQQSHLLNSQTGEYEKVKIEKLGRQTIKIVDQQVAANRYRINTKKFSIDLWYSDEGEWLSLRSTTEDGNVLTYKLRRGI